MKKFIITSLFSLMCISTWAVDIIVDDNLPDSRFIQTDYVSCIDKTFSPLHFSLTMSAKGGDTTYSIIFKLFNTVQVNYPPQMMIAFKLIGGEKYIKGYNTKDITHIDNERAGDVGYFIYPSFNFSKKEIEMMIEQGVGKIRIQKNYIDSYMQIPGDKICKPTEFIFTTRLQSLYFEIYRRLGEFPNQQSLTKGM